MGLDLSPVKPFGINTVAKCFAAAILILSASTLTAQEMIITGKVLDNYNQPLPGANISIQGTGRGTISDFDGNYEIEASAGETLVFSYVGFNSRQIEVGDATVLEVTLQPGYNLDEVLLIGYGTATRVQLTDNIASVKSEQIKEIPVASLQGALVGKAAGVQVTQSGGRAESGFRIRVRGVTTNTGNQEPLYVIDGIPIHKDDVSVNDSPINDLIALNPADIESVEILKDASAAAIYGSRGTNGVVLIKTKQGRSGKTRFSFQSSYGWSEANNKLDWLNTEEYVGLLTESGLNAGFSEEQLADLFNRYATEEADWREARVNTDWQDLALVSGSVQDVNFSASGGDPNTTFFLSAGYNNTKGILRGNDLERYSLRANIEHSANDWLTVGINSNLAKTQLSRIANDGSITNPLQAVSQVPYSRPYLEDGVTPNTQSTYFYNFLMNEFNADLEANLWKVFAKIYGQVALSENLDFRSEFGYDFSSQLEERFYGSQTLQASVNGVGQANDVKDEKYVLNNYFQYRFNQESWQLEATLGMSYEELLVKGFDVVGQEFPSDQLRKLDSAGEIFMGSSSEWRSSLVSYFARASATLFESWLLKASIRVDGSSRFGSDSRFGTFPAASVGWLASREPFLSGSRTISNLKLRASWGITGNSNIDPFASRTQFTTNAYDRSPGFILEQLGDSSLGWEETRQLDVGLDLGLFENRLNVSFDYYDKLTDGILLSVPVPATNGTLNVTRNSGKIQNSGFEWVLESRNVSLEDFSWNTSLNMAFNRNEVKSLPGGDDIPLGSLKITREGEAVASFIMPEYAGVDPANGDALFYQNTELPDGTLDRTTTNNYNEAARRIQGDPYPDLIGGLTNNFRYKGFDLSFTFQGEWGAQLYNLAGNWQSSNAAFPDNQTRDQLNRWQQPGDITDVPQARLFQANGYQNSTRYLEDADFIRLRNMTLGYSLPAELTEQWGLSRIRFYFTGVNLLTITDYKGWDPESTSDFYQRDSAASGIDFYSPPQARTLTLGINVDF